MPNANSITGILPFVSEICILRLCKRKLPPNTKTADSVSVEGKIFLLWRLFLSRCRRWSEAAPSHDPLFFIAGGFKKWNERMNEWRCGVYKRHANFPSLLWLHSIFFFECDCLAGAETRPARHRRSILTLFTFIVVSWSFSSLLHWRSIRTDPGVWCSINTATHAQTCTRVAGSISSCFQTSFL